MLAALSDKEADFIIIGAYAMAAHGLVRATADIDIRVRPTPENAARVWSALRAFGAPLDRMTPDDFTQPGIVFQIGVKPVRIDLLTSISGVDDFEEAFIASKIIKISGLTVAVLSREHLIGNKRASGRPKDLNDVVWLESETE